MHDLSNSPNYQLILQEGREEGRKAEIIRLLQSWREEDEEEDEQEQRATWEELKRALDEDRLSDRKLFP